MIPCFQTAAEHPRQRRPAHVEEAQPVGGDQLGAALALSLEADLSRFSRAAQTSIPVWVHGPEGTPRKAVAARIHQASFRSSAAFSAVDCRWLQPGAPELFEEERGASLLTEAEEGTVYLEHVDALDEQAQARLARHLQLRALAKERGRKLVPDVRLVVGGPVDLRIEAQHERFRPDLLYRLAGLTFRIPPLGDRPEDLTGLLETWRDEEGRAFGPRLTDSARAALSAYPWPGNEEELRLVLARAALLADGELVEVEHIFPPRPGAGDLGLGDGEAGDAIGQGALEGSGALAAPRGFDRILSFAEYEAVALRAALEKTEGNVTQAARLLGIGRATFYRKARKIGLRL